MPTATATHDAATPDAATTAARTWDVWSTTAVVVVTDPALLDRAADAVAALLEQADAAASRFRPDSEVHRLADAGGVPVPVSPLLGLLVAEALDAAEDTDGSVDPTVGAALAALGYDRDIREVHDEAQDAVPLPPTVTWRDVELTGGGHGGEGEADVVRVPPGLVLDLGATAKAAVADLAARLVHTRLGCGVLVGLGGDLATAGPAPDERGWQVTVQDTADDPAQQVSLPGGAALATSSTVRRAWRRGSARVHHVVDPATGRSAPDTWRSVSVAAPTCVEANAAATATIVRGPAGEQWLAERGVAARLVDRDGRVHLLGGWPA
ncbi:FAD:protein FMN transferase [Nocardioides sp. GY 10127]|uniref:FAD:protein FMN transferase n=1 Tax=Nocardioides sp. GY 10127 TaxID=2569762 RepID=UPI0010A7B08E|nr:FAD:protein FMN transferase [Nocardioides sp. GY 10127]TIC81866.1 FAD:protein FMN transferase [Nocardioides sp. GY 10127]